MFVRIDEIPHWRYVCIPKILLILVVYLSRTELFRCLHYSISILLVFLILKWSPTENDIIILKKGKNLHREQNQRVQSNTCCILSRLPFYWASKLGCTIYCRNRSLCWDVGKLHPLRLRMERGRTEHRIARRSRLNESISNWEKSNGKSS